MGYGPRYLGGAEHQAGLLASELARNGRAVTIYAPSVSTSRPDVTPRGVRIAPVPSLGFPRTRTATFLPMLALTQLALGRKRPDILHTHLAWYQAVLPEQLKRITGQRTLVKFACSGVDGEIATLSRSRSGRFALKSIRNADLVVALTDAVADELQAAGFSSNRIRRIPNGVEIAPPAAPAADIVDSSRPVVVFAGRLTAQKGIVPFLDAWSEVVAVIRSATLVIAGTGPLEAAVRSRGSRPDLSGNVRILGPRTDIGAVLVAADAAVIPSRSEGMSNVALEALVAGTPVFGFAIPGVREVVPSADTLAPPGDFRMLARQLISALQAPERLLEFGLAGQAHVRSRFAIEHVAQRYEEAYHDLRA